VSLSSRIVDFVRDNPESTAAEIARGIDDIQDSDQAARFLHGLHKSGRLLRSSARPYRYVCPDDPNLSFSVPCAATAPAQPEVADNNTGSGRPELDGAQSSAGAPAAAKHEPQGRPCGAAFDLREAMARTLPQGAAIDISMDHRATLVIATCEGELELTPAQTLTLGDFLHATQGVWRP
jgi:hypothetical protein